MSKVALVVMGLLLTAGCLYMMRSFMADRAAEDHNLSIWHKGCASLCFVGLSIVMAIHCRDWDYAWKLILALTLGLIGDELLALRFIQRERHDQWFTLGGLFFAFGHLLYIWAVWQRSGGGIGKTVNMIFVLMIALSGLYSRFMKVDSLLMRVGSAMYVALVCYMGAAACGAAIEECTMSTLLMALGGLGFVISDNLLINYSFGNDQRASLDWTIHISYYTAQLLIAWSIFFAK